MKEKSVVANEAYINGSPSLSVLPPFFECQMDGEKGDNLIPSPIVPSSFNKAPSSLEISSSYASIKIPSPSSPHSVSQPNNSLSISVCSRGLKPINSSLPPRFPKHSLAPTVSSSPLKLCPSKNAPSSSSSSSQNSLARSGSHSREKKSQRSSFVPHPFKLYNRQFARKSRKVWLNSKPLSSSHSLSLELNPDSIEEACALLPSDNHPLKSNSSSSSHSHSHSSFHFSPLSLPNSKITFTRGTPRYMPKTLSNKTYDSDGDNIPSASSVEFDQELEKEDSRNVPFST